jgi:hypothetical protein
MQSPKTSLKNQDHNNYNRKKVIILHRKCLRKDQNQIMKAQK